MSNFHLSEGGSATPKPKSEGIGKAVHVRVKHELDGGGDEFPRDIDYSFFLSEGAALATSASVDQDGRIVFSLRSKTPLPDLPPSFKTVPEFGLDSSTPLRVPLLSILITVVGSRGDIQPFLPLAHGLQKAGHRVRLATHAVFRDMVLENNIEFFEIGGDPADLMSYMVKNPGLMPGFESLRSGDIPRKRKMIGEILEGCWKACYDPDPISGEAFAADAIISNPPSFAHIHCAEALNVPLHVVFTMPWISTQAFPHPLVNVSQSNASPGMTNYLTYVLVDLLSWQGLGDVINNFRKKSLGLKPLSLRSGPLILERLRIPTLFCWSNTLIPKPRDWAEHIDVTGFLFLKYPSFQPPADLKAFLDAGSPPIYIGFGSVPVLDPKAMTSLVLSAVKASGVRALISTGWGKLGDGLNVPPNVCLVGNVPHDWLFERVAAVVHHGGAGTTAIAVRSGKPSLVVPFFGDQPFWGEMVARAGAGPNPIHHTKLTAENLADSLRFLLRPETLQAARRMGERIRTEDGVATGLDSFYRHLPLLNMRCDLHPSRVAVWWSPSEYLKISAFAAQVLSDAKKLDLTKLHPHRAKTYATRADITDPITGGGFAIFRTILDYHVGIGQIFLNPVKGIPKTITAIPLGVANIVGSTSEGFRNLPKVYGGEVREVGEITDFSSGVREAGKGFIYGYADAIFGVFREPVKGAKKEGALGFLKGGARGIADAMLKPAAGGLGLVEHSSRGAWASLTKSFGPQVERISKQASTRKAQGRAAVESSTSTERDQVLNAWERLLEEKGERKKRLEDEVGRWEKELQEAGRGEEVDVIMQPEPKKGAVVDEEGGASGKSAGEEMRKERGLSKEQIEAAERRGYARARAELEASQLASA